MATIEGKHIEHWIGQQQVLESVDLILESGEILAVTGPSGSGKTTLLHCLAGLQRPSGGEVWFEGERLDSRSTEERSAVRLKKFGFVLQYGELLPQLTLRENVALPLLLNGVPRVRSSELASAELERFAIDQPTANRFPGQVSGGEGQRAAVARALVHRPSIIFADEPTGSLDRDNGAAVMQAFVSAARQSKASIVLVTHDPTTAAFADRSLKLTSGTLIESMA